ncbi:MAG: aminodeoxychorismate lyase [Bacillaceae bacterium]|nr:aminodeoxychorismate lyase [Bacillaceae bacterium]
MYIYVNGEYLRADQAKISPFDHGYLYGIGLFETLRLYNGHPFLLDDHFRRLQQSMFELNITYSLVKEDLLAIIDKLSQLNDLPNAYIRVNVSAGSAPIGLSSEVYTEPTVIVFMKELPQVVSRFRDAVILKTNRNTPEGQRRLKSHHYLNNMIAKRELGSRDKEGVFLTKEGYVAESIVSNIFWSKGKTVYTPSIETGILNGITRQFITSLLRKQGIHVKEGFFY